MLGILCSVESTLGYILWMNLLNKAKVQQVNNNIKLKIIKRDDRKVVRRRTMDLFTI